MAGKKTREVMVTISSHQIARSEARAIAEQANALGATIAGPPENLAPGKVAAFLTLAGLAIELYLKSFMVAARGGRVTTGHDLQALYAEFPQFLKASFEHEYAKRLPPNSTYRLVAIRPSPTPPPKPTNEAAGYKFATFQDAVDSLAVCFVAFRYFFEGVAPGTWRVAPFPQPAVSAALAALESTYAQFEAGKLTGSTNAVK